jgi:hypothetical protein
MGVSGLVFVLVFEFVIPGCALLGAGYDVQLHI